MCSDYMLSLGQNSDPALQIKPTTLVSIQSIFCTADFPLGFKAALCSVEHCWHLLTLETIKAFTPQFPDLQYNIMPCDFCSQFMKPILFSQSFLLNVCRIRAVFELESDTCLREAAQKMHRLHIDLV